MTNVGIHTRAGRERIHTQHVAHVLNDETQRKYLQVQCLCFMNFPPAGRRGSG